MSFWGGNQGGNPLTQSFPNHPPHREKIGLCPPPPPATNLCYAPEGIEIFTLTIKFEDDQYPCLSQLEHCSCVISEFVTNSNNNKAAWLEKRGTDDGNLINNRF